MNKTTTKNISIENLSKSPNLILATYELNFLPSFHCQKHRQKSKDVVHKSELGFSPRYSQHTHLSEQDVLPSKLSLMASKSANFARATHFISPHFNPQNHKCSSPHPCLYPAFIVFCLSVSLSVLFVALIAQHTITHTYLHDTKPNHLDPASPNQSKDRIETPSRKQPNQPNPVKSSPVKSIQPEHFKC